jgi:lysozyme family protein
MKQNYNYALQQVLKSEGGYTNDPKDPGGPTNFGITIADYRMYVNKNATVQDVKNMHLADAQSIYRSKYWNALQCDSLPSGVDYCVFDYGVNSGIGRARKVWNQVKTDDPKTTINAICDERLRFLKSLSTWSHFGAGWGSRVATVRAGSLKLAGGMKVPSTPTATPTSSIKPTTIPGVTIDDVNNKVTTSVGLFTTIKTFFSDNIGSLGRHTSTSVVTGLGATSAFFTKDWPYVLGGTVVFAVIVWIGLKLYQNKGII